MAVGDTVTEDWDIEFNGLALGEGTPFLVALVEGLADLPAVRSGDQTLLRTDGLWAGEDFLGGRTITISVEVDQRTTTTAFDELASAFVPGQAEQPLVMQIPRVAGGAKIRVNARARRRSAPINLEWLYDLPVIVVELDATDPRIYADTPTTISGLGLAAATGGLTWPLTWLLDWGTFNSGTFTAFNGGNYATPVAFTFAGPLERPRVENLTQSRILEFDVSLAAGDTLVVDTGARTALIGGTASRSGTMTADSQWFHLGAGTETIRFAANSGSGTLAAEWRSAWI